jgi:heme/copper-type cytochrome/quinol oxidase subunit 4
VTVAETREGPRLEAPVAVWFGLVLIVVMQVVVTYAHLPAWVLVASLLALALVEAGLGLMYLMHLKYEHPALRWSVVSMLVFVLLMMNQIWPDAYRLLRLRQ